MKQDEMAKWMSWMVIFTCIVLTVFMVFAPYLIFSRMATGLSDMLFLMKLGVPFFWITAVPAYIALGKAWKICKEINANNSFSHKSAVMLRDISRLCLVDSLLYLAAVVALIISGVNDAFGLLLFFGFVFVGVFISVLTAALSHLTEKASKLKQENDLTI